MVYVTALETPAEGVSTTQPLSNTARLACHQGQHVVSKHIPETDRVGLQPPLVA